MSAAVLYTTVYGLRAGVCSVRSHLNREFFFRKEEKRNRIIVYNNNNNDSNVIRNANVGPKISNLLSTSNE